MSNQIDMNEQSALMAQFEDGLWYSVNLSFKLQLCGLDTGEQNSQVKHSNLWNLYLLLWTVDSV